MRRSRQNPRGLHLPLRSGAQVVRVGTASPTRANPDRVVLREATHLFSPNMHGPGDGDILCQSGKNAGRYKDGANREKVLKDRRQGSERLLFLAWAREEADYPQRGRKTKKKLAALTCYRCAKLASVNLKAGRLPWEGPPNG
jgi:hypothetical protein